MEYRHLGASGLQLSALSFGAWVTFGQQIGEDVAYECMKSAYDAGVNFFDNAEVYAGGEAERVMGRVFKKAGWKRSDQSARLFRPLRRVGEVDTEARTLRSFGRRFPVLIEESSSSCHASLPTATGPCCSFCSVTRFRCVRI